MSSPNRRVEEAVNPEVLRTPVIIPAVDYNYEEPVAIIPATPPVLRYDSNHEIVDFSAQEENLSDMSGEEDDEPYRDITTEHVYNFHPMHEYYENTEETLAKMHVASLIEGHRNCHNHIEHDTEQQVLGKIILPDDLLQTVKEMNVELLNLLKDRFIRYCTYNKDVTEFFNHGPAYYGDWGVPFKLSIIEVTQWRVFIRSFFREYNKKHPEVEINDQCMICCHPVDYRGDYYSRQCECTYKKEFFMCPNSTVASPHLLCFDCYETLLTQPKTGVVDHMQCPFCNHKPVFWVWFMDTVYSMQGVSTHLPRWKKLFYSNLRCLIREDDLLFHRVRLNAMRDGMRVRYRQAVTSMHSRLLRREKVILQWITSFENAKKRVKTFAMENDKLKDDILLLTQELEKERAISRSLTGRMINEEIEKCIFPTKPTILTNSPPITGLKRRRKATRMSVVPLPQISPNNTNSDSDDDMENRHII